MASGERDQKAREKLNHKLLEKRKKITEIFENNRGEVQSNQNDRMIAVNCHIIEHISTVLLDPEMSVESMLKSSSLSSRIKRECQLHDIKYRHLKQPITIPTITNSSTTIKQWLDAAGGNENCQILLQYNDEIGASARCNKTEPPQNPNKTVVSSNAPESSKLSSTELAGLKELIEKLNIRIDQQDAANKLIKEDYQKLKTTNKDLSMQVINLMNLTKPLVFLHQRILIEQARLRLSKNYVRDYEIATGNTIDKLASYSYIQASWPQFETYLRTNDILNQKEKAILDMVTSRSHSMYRTISDDYIHYSDKASIAASILRIKSQQNMWINMFIYVFDEAPSFDDQYSSLSLTDLHDETEREE